jgi:phosphopantetheinyl transferase
MPLVYQQDINDYTRMAIWEIDENESFFADVYIPPRTITHPQKRLQTMAGRFLLKRLFPDIPLREVRIAPTRKPFIPGDAFHFSISHCDNFAAAIVSTKERVGIDIEIPQQKITLLKHKFLTLNEQSLFEALPLPEIVSLTIGWSMKEALFKWYGKGSVDFKNHMRVENITLNETDGFQSNGLFIKENVESVLLKGFILSWMCCVFLHTD